jgi:sugar phosphate permease
VCSSDLFGIIGIVFSFVLFFLLRDSNSDIGSLKEKNDMEGLSFVSGMKDLFSKKSFILLLIFWSFIGLVGWMIIGWLPTYYKEHFNLSQTNSGLYATGYFYPLGIAGVLVGGYLADRWSNKSDTSRIMVPILGLCLAAPGVFIASSTSIYYIAIAGFMIYGFTRYFSDTNLMPILCMVADKRYIATGYGTLNLFSCIVGGVGIYLSGLLRDADIDMALQFKIAAFTMLICAGLLYLVKRDVENSSKK